MREQQLVIADKYAALAGAPPSALGREMFYQERALVMLAAAVFKSNELKQNLKRVGEAIEKGEEFQAFSYLRNRATMLMYVEALELEAPESAPTRLSN